MANQTVTKTGKKSFKEWFYARKVQRWLVIGTFMFVPLLLLLVFTYVPFIKMVQFSFYNMKYTGTRTFVGIKKYFPEVNVLSHCLLVSTIC